MVALDHGQEPAALDHTRNHLILPEKPFDLTAQLVESLSLSSTEQFLVRSDLDTLEFAQKQVAQAEECLKKASAQDERILCWYSFPEWPC